MIRRESRRPSTFNTFQLNVPRADAMSLSTVTFIPCSAFPRLTSSGSPSRISRCPFRRRLSWSSMKGLTTMGMSGNEPPRVKSSFYKNPSKAIEKGGGFYIPGLRGPRLRFFVSTVAASLLTLNHVFSPRVSVGARTLQTSELLSVFAILFVFSTAIYDTIDSSKTTSTSTSATTTDSSVLPTTESVQQSSNPVQQSDPTDDQIVNWALSTCTDLTKATHIAVFQGGALKQSTENILSDKQCGPVVERVVKEQKSLFVSNTNDLPPDVTLPFLGDGEWCVFVVPVDIQSAVVFAKQKDSSAGFPAEARRWLESFATRLVE